MSGQGNGSRVRPTALAASFLLLCSASLPLAAALPDISLAIPAPGWLSLRVRFDQPSDMLIDFGVRSDAGTTLWKRAGYVMSDPRVVGFTGGKLYKTSAFLDVEDADVHVATPMEPIDPWLQYSTVRQQQRWQGFTGERVFTIFSGAKTDSTTTFLADVTLGPGASLLGRTEGSDGTYQVAQWDSGARVSAGLNTRVANERARADGTFTYTFQERAFGVFEANCVCEIQGPGDESTLAPKKMSSWTLRGAQPGARSIHILTDLRGETHPDSVLFPDYGDTAPDTNWLAVDVVPPP